MFLTCWGSLSAHTCYFLLIPFPIIVKGGPFQRDGALSLKEEAGMWRARVLPWPCTRAGMG